VVGALPASNSPDDVVLVKAFLKKIGDVPLDFSPEVAAACKAITVNTTSDATLVAAIKAFQNDVKTKKGNSAVVVDGRVSPANASYRYAPNVPWIIVQLNLMMKSPSRVGPVWPCVHLDSTCDASLASVAKNAIFGVDV
jgi:hypothetical protein